MGGRRQGKKEGGREGGVNGGRDGLAIDDGGGRKGDAWLKVWYKGAISRLHVVRCAHVLYLKSLKRTAVRQRDAGIDGGMRQKGKRDKLSFQKHIVWHYREASGRDEMRERGFVQGKEVVVKFMKA